MAKITITNKKDKTVEWGREENGLVKIRSQYSDRLTKALTYKATSVETYGKGGELLKLFNEAGKRAKEEKAKVLDPAELTVKRIKEQWKPFEESLKACVKHIKDEMETFMRLEEERKQQAVQKVLNDKRIKNNDTRVEKILAIREDVPTGNTRNVLELVIFDPLLIPREYLLVDESKVRAALREGKDVPGAKLENRKLIVAR